MSARDMAARPLKLALLLACILCNHAHDAPQPHATRAVSPFMKQVSTSPYPRPSPPGTSPVLFIAALTALANYPVVCGAQSKDTLQVQAHPEAANAPTPDAATGFDSLIVMGLEAFHAERYHDARAYFQRAHAQQPSARTLRALGMTDFALNAYTRARTELERALVHPTLPLSDEHRVEVAALLDWMIESLSAVRLEYLPAHATATVDGAPVHPGDLLLEPGEHTLRLQAPQYQPLERVFVVARFQEPFRLRVELDPISEAPRAIARTNSRRDVALEESRRSPQHNAGRAASPGAISAMVIGAAGLVASGATAIAALVVCSGTDCESQDAYSTYRTLRDVSTVTFYAGAGVALAGLGLWWLRPVAGDDDTLVLHAAPGFVSLSGRF